MDNIIEMLKSADFNLNSDFKKLWDIPVVTAQSDNEILDEEQYEFDDEKIKKKEGDNALELERTEDILAYIGANKQPGQFICGFSMETENMLENVCSLLIFSTAVTISEYFFIYFSSRDFFKPCIL